MALRSLLLCAALAVCNAGLIGKYYSTKDCTGKYEWRVDDTINFDEVSWKFGPRGRTNSFCVEWTGSIDIAANSFLWLDADDGVILRLATTDADLQLQKSTIIDRWNSYDTRPCHNSAGCKAPAAGRYKILIRYYQDFGPAHIVFKWGANADFATASLVPATALITPANPTGSDASALVTLKSTTCCYSNLGSCGATPQCNPTASKPGVINPRLYARVGEATDISKSTFWDGKGLNGAAFFTVGRCSENLFVSNDAFLNTALPNDDNVVVEVAMGSYVDYFKPLPGKNLCDMLMSSQNHLWSATGDPYTFVRPAYYNTQTLLGGSDDDWPLYNIVDDRRKHLPFWGGNGAQGGCCQATVGDTPAWNRGFVMRIFPLLPGLTAPTLPAFGTTWTRIAWVSGQWNTETGDATKPWNLLVTRGLRDSADAINNGRLYFVRKCSTFDSAADKFVIKLCFAPKSGEEVECDLFRPTAGSNLCTMLQSRVNHEWSYDNGVSWAKPEPYINHAGGSAQWWPKQFCSQEVTNTTTGVKTKVNNCGETRQFIPFWAGYRGGYNWLDRNGNPNAEGSQGWSRDYTMSIRKI